ncbi:MAG: dephospho-CoA kinase [Chloroflexota bacterium]|nr:dephospho-CoA kinase [Chloroflexota bacterium]
MTDGRDRRPFVIGITDNIGTGKSTVARMLGDLGAEVIDADKLAHRVMEPGSETYARVVKAFGSRIVAGGGEIDRQELGAIVFSDPDALALLEEIVHPATLERIERRIASADADAVVIEAIKLIESGLADACDSVWVVTCRPDQQIERVVAQRDLSREEAALRVEAQGPQVEKLAHADVVIDNSGSLAVTRQQVRAAWDRVMAAAGRSRRAAWN